MYSVFWGVRLVGAAATDRTGAANPNPAPPNSQSSEHVFVFYELDAAPSDTTLKLGPFEYVDPNLKAPRI